jgi:Insertion element 4 transposase N-terminal/Transposase DDE domain
MAANSVRRFDGSRISDVVSLGVLTTTLPPTLIDEVLTATGRHSHRKRQLPARTMVYYVIALALYGPVSCTEVLRCLIEGLRWLRRGAGDLPVACKSAITQARTRPGPEPLRRLYAAVARPLARPDTPGAWYRRRRLVSIDGTTIDLPDTPAVDERYGRPGAVDGAAGYPQLRLVTLTETGTRAAVAAAFDRCRVGEAVLVRRLLDHLGPGMLCLADRGFSGFALWRRAAATGADLLWRVRGDRILPCHQALPDGSYISRLYADQRHRRHDRAGMRVRVIDYRLRGQPDAAPVYRLITTILDPAAAPAAELAALYHERWEAETTFAEIKVTLPGGRLMLRSRRPDLVEQEVYGLLLAHSALRALMLQASEQAACDPDTLSFVHAVRVVRRQVSLEAAFSPSAAPPGVPHGPDHDHRGAG